ncbi:hypothetical protein D7X12_15660 [Corallococcus sicarius]|uniref:Uncharacterized protein n=1 Tax=Corallococcus sicarius TaxID=2316726 RepID=A0A3A8NDN9_9BACT|nr:hypothetical protein D7X12_15660 [Corallococcus sicarius]
MNWNNTQFDGGEPITVRAARSVGDIMKNLPSACQKAVETLEQVVIIQFADQRDVLIMKPVQRRTKHSAKPTSFVANHVQAVMKAYLLMKSLDCRVREVLSDQPQNDSLGFTKVVIASFL